MIWFLKYILHLTNSSAFSAALRQTAAHLVLSLCWVVLWCLCRRSCVSISFAIATSCWIFYDDYAARCRCSDARSFIDVRFRARASDDGPTRRRGWPSSLLLRALSFSIRAVVGAHYVARGLENVAHSQRRCARVCVSSERLLRARTAHKAHELMPLPLLFWAGAKNFFHKAATIYFII